MKQQKEQNAKKTKGSAKSKSPTSLHRDQETVELFTELLDRSCPRE